MQAEQTLQVFSMSTEYIAHCKVSFAFAMACQHKLSNKIRDSHFCTITLSKSKVIQCRLREGLFIVPVVKPVRLQLLLRIVVLVQGLNKYPS